MFKHRLITLFAVTALLAVTVGAGVVAEQLPELAGSEWRLMELDGEPLSDDVEVLLRFNDEAVAGQAPVNRFFGSYELADQQLTFSRMGATRMAGPEHLMQLETKFMAALEAVRCYCLADGELQMQDEAGATRLVFARTAGSQELAGTEWILKLIDGEELPEQAEITASFSEDQVSGQAPVNGYFAAYEIADGALSFGQVGRTLMAGPEHLMQLEERFLQKLEAVASYRVMEGRLEAFDEAGDPVLLFGLARGDMSDVEIIDPGAHLDLAEGQLWVPMRPIAEWLGATVKWDADTRTATAVLGEREFSVHADENVAHGWGQQWSPQFRMLQPSGMIYAPLDALTSVLGARVIRQPDDHVLIIEIDGRRGALTAP